jgi:branched-chain amino acid transport system substrate-binding protein
LLQIRDKGLATTLVGGDALATEEFWSITGPAGEGTLMTFGPDPRLNSSNTNLVKSFRDHGYEPEAYTLYTYAAIQVWSQAVAKANSTETAKVSAILHSDTFNTVLGRTSFDAKGDMKSGGYVLYVWTGGKYIYAD